MAAFLRQAQDRLFDCTARTTALFRSELALNAVKGCLQRLFQDKMLAMCGQS
jgi:hypothetical protein